jgi:CheY-like chemotaxis protein
MNVVSNAVNLSPLSGDRVLSIAAWLPWPDMLQIEVADRGPGLRGQTMAQLTTEFNESYDRVASSAGITAGIRSSGLGIPICVRLAELMGGSATLADRTDGPGARFTLRLPLALGAAAANETRGAALASQGAREGSPLPSPATIPGSRLQNCVRGRRALAVDDSPANLRFAVYWLRRMGCTVQTCTDGDQVVDAVGTAVAAGAPFDVIIMDLRMERLDGDGALAALRAAGHALPVVLSTAHATAADTERYRGLGFAALLAKPFSPEQLRGAISRALTIPGGEQ